MESKAWLVALVAAGTLLAGCAAQSSKTPADSASDPSLGILRGVVVDPAVHPLANAVVTLLGMDRANTTGPDGLFAFPDLAPGEYSIQVGRDGYVGSTTTVQVAAGSVGKTVQVQLEVQVGSARYATVYKFDGLYECGVWPTNGCANVNIVTGIMLCQTQVPCFNVTSDRSIFLQWVDGGMQSLQSEVAWEATLETGAALEFSIGGANREELSQGYDPVYNFTDGVSPLMLRVTNHEGDTAWCRQNGDPPCGERALEESKIGGERALLVQIGSGATYKVAGGCSVSDPCGTGASLEQPFSVYTTTFYGYEPPADWLFSTTGEVPPPPA